MHTFSKAYVLEFPRELVFSKWVAEDTVVSPAEKMEIELRVGGTYRLLMPGGAAMEGVFSVFAENERVTYSWNWIGSDETTEVEVTFQDHADGTEIQDSSQRTPTRIMRPAGTIMLPDSRPTSDSVISPATRRRSHATGRIMPLRAGQFWT
jgi:uncharacterized protein YndB with AHSA1/START domain